VHPYNQAKDNAARQIQTNYNKIDLVGFIGKGRTNLEAIRQEALKVTQQSLITEGDFRLLSIMDSTTDNLQDAFVREMTPRLKDLTGVSDLTVVASNYARMKSTYLLLPDLVRFIDEAASEVIKIAHKSPPPFDWQTMPPPDVPPDLIKGLSGVKLHEVKVWYTSYLKCCADALKAHSEVLAAFPTGAEKSIHGAVVEWEQSIAKLSAARHASNVAQAALDAVVTNYAAKAQTDAAFWNGDYTNAAKAVKQALAALGSKNAFGADKAVQTKLDAVNFLLDAAVAGQFNQAAASSNDLLRAAIVSASMPKLAAEVQAAVGAFRTPRLSSLMIEKELLSVQKDFTARQVERQQAAVDLSFQQIRVMLEEFNDYYVISQIFDRSKAASRVTNETSPFLLKMADFFAHPPSDADYREVVEVFTTYCIACRGPQMQQAEITSLKNDLYYQEALDADEAALKAWNAIMSTPINQLVAYYGAGFKPAEVADLVVKALGFAAIAARLK
jgi:hypothetical protein